MILKQPMHSLMTKTPLTIEAGALAVEALKIMQKHSKKMVMQLPVIHQDKVVGLVRMHDIVSAGLTVGPLASAELVSL